MKKVPCLVLRSGTYDIYDDIARAITAAVAARPEAKKLLTQRTFVRALH